MYFYMFISSLEFMLIALISFINYKQLHLISILTEKIHELNFDMPILESDEETESEDGEQISKNVETDSETDNDDETTDDDSETGNDDETTDDIVNTTKTDDEGACMNTKKDLNAVDIDKVMSDSNILKQIFMDNDDYGNIINSLSQMLIDADNKSKIL